METRSKSKKNQKPMTFKPQTSPKEKPNKRIKPPLPPKINQYGRKAETKEAIMHLKMEFNNEKKQENTLIGEEQKLFGISPKEKEHYNPTFVGPKGCIGSSDFKELRRLTLHLVDKSKLIQDFIESDAKVVARRFGKSSNLSMIKTFLELGLDKEGKMLDLKEKKLQIIF